MQIRCAAAFTSLVLLAACAGMEPSGRSAEQGAAPAPATRTLVEPPPSASLPPPQQTPAPPPVAQQTPAPTPPAAQQSEPAGVASPAVPPPPPVRRTTGNEVVVPGVRERQVESPDEDPRSTTERMRDIRAWDRCVMRIQGRADSDPMRPQLESPEEVCSRSLGMASRTAVPDSRRP